MTALTVLCACNPITPDKPGTEEPDKPGDEVQLPDVVKILAIGNSFSADAVEQELYGLFAAEGKDVIIGNLYIGGCPLATHAEEDYGQERCRK